MGVKHLIELRGFLKKNSSESYNRTDLKDILKQNFNMVETNLNYLKNIENCIIESEQGQRPKYQWKNE